MYGRKTSLVLDIELNGELAVRTTRVVGPGFEREHLICRVVVFLSYYGGSDRNNRKNCEPLLQSDGLGWNFALISGHMCRRLEHMCRRFLIVRKVGFHIYISGLSRGSFIRAFPVVSASGNKTRMHVQADTII